MILAPEKQPKACKHCFSLLHRDPKGRWADDTGIMPELCNWNVTHPARRPPHEPE